MAKLFIKYFSYYFLVIAVIELVCVQWYPSARVITKPLLMISLIAFYALSCRHIDKPFLGALCFAFLGDTFLLSENFFLYGLGSFLIMQLLYAYCFFKQSDRLTSYKVIGIIGIGLMTAAMLYNIVPDLENELRVPVIVYSVSIGLMAIAAIVRVARGNQYKLILFGVISFLISDSILGLNKFGNGLEYAGLLVMLTYIIAQYLIVTGYLQFEEGNNATS